MSRRTSKSICLKQNQRLMEACDKIISRVKVNPQNQQDKIDRLSFKDIQNITKSMIKDKKVHEQNMGVISNIKGKMYCLALGKVSASKEFQHYFYSNIYKKKIKRETEERPYSVNATSSYRI